MGLISEEVEPSKLVARAIAIANGSAPDLYGWSGELIGVLLRDHDCHEALKELTCLIRDDALPERARRAIVGKDIAMIFQDPLASLNPWDFVANFYEFLSS